MIGRLAFAAVVVAGCTELPEIQTRVCGNGIVEAREDCDHRDQKCVSCSWECSEDGGCTSAGPAFHCGIDNVCYGPSGKFDPTPRAQHAFPVLGFRITDIDFDGIGDVVGLNQTALNVRYGEATGDLPDFYNVVTPQVAGNAVLTHLVDDAIDDLVIPAADGLVVYTGAFGVPSPRQFPSGGDDPGNMGDRPDPFDGVQIDDTIGLFGADKPAELGTQYLAFSILAVTPFGPAFDAATIELCGQQVTNDAQSPTAKWLNESISSYRSASGETFVAFTHDDKTCVIKISRRAVPVARGSSADCLPIPGATPTCQYQVETLGSYSPALSQYLTQYSAWSLPRFADLDGTGCPSLLAFDPAVSNVRVFQAMTGCQLASSEGPARIATGPYLIGAIRLDDQPVACVDPPPFGSCSTPAAPDALITPTGIQAIEKIISPGSWTAALRPLYISDRLLRRAVVADIDSDTVDDVVFSTNQPNLDVARRVPGSDYFLLLRTPTSGPIVQTVIADYDGDLRADLAYVEDLGTAQRLSIAYGSATGLDVGIAADVFKQVAFMAYLQVPDSTDPFSLVDDLIAIDVVQQGEPEITILHGSPSRTMLSYFGPPVSVAGSAFRGVVGGDFLDSTPVENSSERDRRTEGITDLVAFQTFSEPSQYCAPWQCQTAVWVVPGLPNARLGDAQYTSGGGPEPVIFPASEPDVFGRCSDGPKQFCVEGAKFVAWPVVTSPDPALDHDIVIGVDPAGNVLRFDPGIPWDQNPSPVSAGPFNDGGGSPEIIVFDVDNDGLEELVAPFASTGAFDGHVDICRMNRDGTFAAATCVDVAKEIIQDDQLECVAAITGSVLPACTPEGQRDQLVVLCRRALGDEIALSTREQSFVIPIVVVGGQLAAGPHVLTTAGQLDDVQIGDVTGDAVDDIIALDIISGTAVLEVFTQYTTRDYDACRD